MELVVGGFLKVGQNAIQITNRFGTIPMQWNLHKKKFQSISKTKLYYLKWRFVITTLYLALGVVQVFWKWKESDPLVKAFGGSLIATIITTLPPTYVGLTQTSEIVAMMNGMIRFELKRQKDLERVYPRSNSTLEGACVRYACKGMALALTYVQIIFCFVVMMNPCFPTFTGYWIAPQCQEKLGFLQENRWNMAEVFCRGIIAAVGFYCWVVIVPPTGLTACFAIIKGFCVSSYIICFKKQVGTAKILDGSLNEKVQMCREIQILLIHFQEIYSNIILVTFACGGIFSQILFLYTATDLYRSGLAFEQPVWIVACAWGGITYVIAIFALYGNLATVYNSSFGALNDILRNVNLMKNAWFRRYVRGCPVLCVHLGPYNFIDKGTPTNMEEFVVDQLISLLLLEA